MQYGHNGWENPQKSLIPHRNSNRPVIEKSKTKQKNCNNTWSIQLRNMMWLSPESADRAASADAIFRIISPFLAVRQSKMAAKLNNCNNNTWSIQLRNMMWLSPESADRAASVDANFRMISPFLAILLRKTVKLHFLDPKINDFRKILTKVLNLDTWYCYH